MPGLTHQRVAALVKKKNSERPYGNPCYDAGWRGGSVGLHTHRNVPRHMVKDLSAEESGQQIRRIDPQANHHGNQHNCVVQLLGSNDQERVQQEHRPQGHQITATLMQHAEGRMGDYQGPREEQQPGTSRARRNTSRQATDSDNAVGSGDQGQRNDPCGNLHHTPTPSIGLHEHKNGSSRNISPTSRQNAAQRSRYRTRRQQRVTH